MLKSTPMVALEAYLRANVHPRMAFFNDAVTPDRLEELRDHLVELGQQMNNIQNTADAEKRDLNSEEKQQLFDLLADFDVAEEEIGRRQEILNVNARLAEPAGRQVDPAPVNIIEDPSVQPEDAPAPTGMTRARASMRSRIPATPRDPAEAGRFGFKSFGEFSLAVKAAVRGAPGQIDPRLTMNAPTTVGTEGAGEDGGFAVPPDFRSEIMVKVAGEDSLLARTDQLTSSSNNLTFPKDETTPWQSSGGLLAFWEGEGNQLTQSKPQLGEENVRLNKLTALVPVTSELLDDAPAMTTYLRRKVPEKFDFKVNDAIINGTGAGQPKGILNSAALVSVAKESGQAADTIVFNNVTNMWTRLYAGCRPRAIWLINQDIETQLIGMQFPGTGTAVPVYLPPGGLAGSPHATLLGKPVIPIESAKTLGDAGDIILTDLSQYLTVMKTGGIRQDVSMHLWFDYDTMAFRFIMRLGGQSWWGSSITPANGSATRSCAVSLAARA